MAQVIILGVGPGLGTGILGPAPPESRINISSSAGTPSANVRVRSVVPLVLADLVTTGLEREAAALIEASGDALPVVGTLYADPDRNGTDSPIDGELGLGADDTVISRIRRTDESGVARLSLADSNNPVALSLELYFDVGGPGRDLTIWVKTADAEASFTVASTFQRGSDNFVHFILPADAQTVIDSIVTGDRFILAFTREPSTSARLRFSSSSGTPSASLTVRSVLAQINARISIGSSAGTPTARLTVRSIPAQINARISLSAAAGTPSGSLTVRSVLVQSNARISIGSSAGTPSANVRIRSVDTSPAFLRFASSAGIPVSQLTIRSESAPRARLRLASSAGTPSASVMVRAESIVSIFVESTEITSTPVALSDTYGEGETIEITVRYNFPVTVTGLPDVRVNFGQNPGIVRFSYAGGSNTANLVFEHIVQATDEDTNGIFLFGSTDSQNRGDITLNGGTIRSVGTAIDANLTTTDRGTKGGHRVAGSLQPTTDARLRFAASAGTPIASLTVRSFLAPGFARISIGSSAGTPSASARVRSIPVQSNARIRFSSSSGTPSASLTVRSVLALSQITATVQISSGTPSIRASSRILQQVNGTVRIVSGRPIIRARYAPPFATYKLEVDWDGNGTYGHADADVYPDIRGRVRARRGKNYNTELYGRATAGSLTCQLYNYDRKYDRFNTGSALFGLVVPGRRVRLMMSINSDTPEQIWGGVLDEIREAEARGGADVATMRARGIFLQLSQEPADTALFSDIETGDAVTEVLNAIDLPADLRGIITTDGQVLPRWWTDDTAMRSLEALEETEGGFLSEDRRGSVAFEGRTDRNRFRTSVFSVSDAPGGDAIQATISKADDPLEEIVNVIRVSYQGGYSVTSEVVLWTLVDTPELSAGESITIRAIYPHNSSPRDHVAVDSWTGLATGDYEANSSADGSGTDLTGSMGVIVTDTATSRTFVVTNNHPTDSFHITRLRARGVALIAGDVAVVPVKNQSSIDAYGVKSFPINARFLGSAARAKVFADFVLLLYKDPQQKSDVTMNMNDFLGRARSVELSERIQVTQRGVTRDMFIEHIEHIITDGNRHDVKIRLNPASPFGRFIILGTGPVLGTGLLG